jgi:four helix bundle protein
LGLGDTIFSLLIPNWKDESQQKETKVDLKDFRKFKVWEKSHHLAQSVYQATSSFPKHERYGLTSQLRRAAVSIPSNIAEGCGRGKDAEFARFIQIASGSAAELQYQLLLANDLHFMEEDALERLSHEVIEVRKMLNALYQKLKANG